MAKNVIGQVVGMGSVTSYGFIDAQLRDIIVLPRYRERGIGSEIVKRLVEYCQENGVPHVGLMCAEHNVGFYKRNGFVST